MATVDHLARMLSEKTGTQFEILRGRVPVMERGERKLVMRYALRARKDDVSYVFQMARPLTLGELTRWLASINDMVVMEFIPVSPA